MFDLPLEEQIEITRNIMSCLDDWGLSATQQLHVLALPAGTRSRKLRSFHQDTPFPNTAEVKSRIAYLLGIIDSLRTSYPVNSAMGGFWMNKSHRRLEGKSPIKIILDGGEQGMRAVLAELDCTYAWDLKKL